MRVHIDQILNWSENVQAVFTKAQSRLILLRKLNLLRSVRFFNT